MGASGRPTKTRHRARDSRPKGGLPMTRFRLAHQQWERGRSQRPVTRTRLETSIQHVAGIPPAVEAPPFTAGEDVTTAWIEFGSSNLDCANETPNGSSATRMQRVLETAPAVEIPFEPNTLVHSDHKYCGYNVTEPLGEGLAADVVDMRSSILAFGDDDSISTLGTPAGRDEVEEVATAHGQEQKPARGVDEHPSFRLFCPTWIRPIDGVRDQSLPTGFDHPQRHPSFRLFGGVDAENKNPQFRSYLGRGDGRIERQLTTEESSRFRGTVRAKLSLSFERHTSLVMMRRGASRTTTEKRSFSRMGRGATAPVATHLRMCRTYT